MKEPELPELVAHWLTMVKLPDGNHILVGKVTQKVAALYDPETGKWKKLTKKADWLKWQVKYEIELKKDQHRDQNPN